MRAKNKILRRIQTLYCLFFVAIIISVALTIMGNDFVTVIHDTHREAAFEQGQSVQNRLFSKVVFGLKSKTSEAEYNIPIVETADSSPIVNARVTRLDLFVVSKNIDQTKSLLTIMANILFLLAVGSYVAIFIVLFLILGSLRQCIKSENIFERRNIIRTRAIGILLIVASLLTSTYTYLEGLFASKFFAVGELTVDTSFTLSFSEIIMGILIMFIAEIFAIGYDQTQEQKLTI